MLEKAFQDVYTKFKLHFYQNVFQRFATREATLTTVESFCMEGIMAMGEPTIAEFSRMMQISTPNAAYKIGSLVKKGYVEKIQSTTDRREYHLRPTQKYIDYYNISYSYLHTVVERARQRFTPEECAKLEQMLTIVSTELMPELDILYMTRVQKERFFNEEDYIRLKNSYVLTREKMAQAKPTMAVLHPLPRVNEIALDVDDDPRAAYFEQVQNGVYVRMALIMTLLGLADPKAPKEEN